MRVFLAIAVGLMLLLAGCIKSANEVESVKQSSQSTPEKVVEETAQPTETPAEPPAEMVEEESGEVVEETQPPVENISISDILAEFRAGNMYHCKGEVNYTLAGMSGTSTYESWFYYDAENNIKKMRYVSKSPQGEGELIAITRVDFANQVEETTVYSKGSVGIGGEACDYQKLVSTTAISTTEEDYEGSVDASEAQTFSFEDDSGSYTMECGLVPYDSSVFEPQGKVCEFSAYGTGS